jgi:hypothetical protein
MRNSRADPNASRADPNASTIAAGLAAAGNGDTLELAPGTYRERPCFGSGSLVVSATGPVVIQ